MENTNTQNNNYSILTKVYFYLGVLAIFAMICINNLTEMQIPAIPFLMVIFVVAIFCDRTELFALIACCVPFSVGFQYKFGILICLAVYLVKYFKDIKFRWPVIISFAVLIVWELLHVIIGGDSFYQFLRDICELLLVVFVAITSLKKVDYTFIVRFFVIACIAIMTVLLITQLKRNDFVFEDIFKRKFRFGNNKDADDRFALSFNPNTLGFICNFCIVGILQLIISKRSNVVDYVCILPLVFFGIMTQSRAFILCLAFLVLMFLFAGEITVKKKLIRAGIVAVICAVVLVLVLILMPTVVEMFLARFETDDISNGRVELFLFYTKHIFSSFKNAMFGIGLQNVGGKLIELYPGVYDVCHNGIQQIVVAWGFPGLIGFGIFVYFVVRNSLKRCKFSLVNYMPTFLILLMIQFDQFLSEGLTLIMFAMSIISMNYAFYEKKVREGETQQVGDSDSQKFSLSNFLANPPEFVKDFLRSSLSALMSDKFYLKLLYYVKFRKKLNLDDPKTFNEKMQWLKLYNRKTIYTIMVDKVDVKEYVADKIGEEYIIPTLGVWENAKDIDFEKLPEKFALKCNHNSCNVVICKDKSQLDIKSVVKKLNSCLKNNYFYRAREWPYKNVLPKVIAEKFVKDKNYECLPVYKVLCFNGEPKIIQTIQNDKQPNATIDYFDTDWNLLELKQNYPNSEIPYEKPDCLEEMLRLSRVLSEKHPFLRVDWYVINGKLKFSEFTFYSDAGIQKFTPEEWDEKLGSCIDLNILKGRVSNGK